MTPLPDRPPREVLRNATRRPVEMLLATGTVVLAPGDTIDLPEGDRTCAVLERKGILTRHARREPEKSAGAGKGKTTRRKAAKAAAKPGAKPAAKPGARKAPKPAAKARKTAKAGAKPAPAPKRKTPSSASKKKRSRKPDGGSA